MYAGTNITYRYKCYIWMKTKISWHIFENNSNMKFRANRFSRSRIATDKRTTGQTDLTELIIFFHILKTRHKRFFTKKWYTTLQDLTPMTLQVLRKSRSDLNKWCSHLTYFHDTN
jgi:hypothetical protein